MVYRYLHNVSPNGQTSGLECNSISTVGIHIISTNRSAMLRLIRKILVELRSSLVLKTTIGTRILPNVPSINMTIHIGVANIRIEAGNFVISSESCSWIILAVLIPLSIQSTMLQSVLGSILDGR